MSRETATKLAALDASRLASLNPDRSDLPSSNPGTAVLNVLGLYAAKPNEATICAMAELEDGRGERFDSTDALFADLGI